MSDEIQTNDVINPPVQEAATQPQPEIQAAAQNPAPAAPALRLPTSRNLIKYILFSIITFEIYPLVVHCKISNEINVVASRYDGKKTMHYALVFFLFSWMTAGIVPLVWICRLCSRMGNELVRRQIGYSFGAKDFWLWNVLGSLILVGPFIFMHKFLKSMNLLNTDFNEKG